MTLIVGHINYINCAPFFHYLPEVGFEGRIVMGVPSYLNHLLASGGIDISPSSSFEYARNWRDYLLLPAHSISAFGPVKSVLLFSSRPLEELDGEKIALTGESATSVNLLHILLREFLGYRNFVCRVPNRPVEEVIAAGGTALLIGDRALKAALNPDALYVYDLGTLWHQYTGLPFVFALWILRRDSAQNKRKDVQALAGKLAASRAMAFASLEKLAARTPEIEWMGEQRLVDYWQCMSYDLAEAHLEGLSLYFRLSVKYGLLDEMPEICFFS
jgi:chorismate dehydratase